jgi:hypothetical protein
MSLQTKITSVVTRIATEFKAVKSLISGNNSGTLTSLDTTNKNSLLEALNEVKGIADGKQDDLGFTPEDESNKGNANGYASLDSGGKVPSSQLPSTSGGTLSLGETSTTAYRGDRGKTAYDHSQVSGSNPHSTTFSQLNSKPTTISGFGITDSFTKTEIGDVTTNFVTVFEAAL